MVSSILLYNDMLINIHKEYRSSCCMGSEGWRPWERTSWALHGCCESHMSWYIWEFFINSTDWYIFFWLSNIHERILCKMNHLTPFAFHVFSCGNCNATQIFCTRKRLLILKHPDTSNRKDTPVRGKKSA